MRLLILLLALALSACDAPMEEITPRYDYRFVEEDRTYEVSAQYDPFVLGYSVRVSDPLVPLSEADRGTVQTMLFKNLSPRLCINKDVLYQVQEGSTLTGRGPAMARHLPDLGMWQFVLACARTENLRF